jgi:hypothetical protein
MKPRGMAWNHEVMNDIDAAERNVGEAELTQKIDDRRAPIRHFSIAEARIVRFVDRPQMRRQRKGGWARQSHFVRRFYRARLRYVHPLTGGVCRRRRNDMITGE